MRSIPVSRLDLRGKSFSLKVPISKSMTNRALILAAQTKGTFELKGEGFEAEDIRLMVQALRQLGVEIKETDRGLQIRNDLSWRGRQDEVKLFLGNSGTSMRFLTSLVTLRKGKTVLTGKDRMKERPLKDLVDTLRQVGVEIEYLEKEGFPPIRIKGKGQVSGENIRIRGDLSSQFISSILLSACSFSGPMELKILGEPVSHPYVELTRHQIASWTEKGTLVAKDRKIEGDASAAVYWWALGKLHDCHVTVTNVPKDTKQPDARFLSLLEEIPKSSAPDDEFDMNEMPDASLMMMAMAPLLDRPTKITRIGNLRVKETDRIEAMATELRKIGSEVAVGKDWIEIKPLKEVPQKKISIATYDDHRIAMSMAILGTRLGNLEILDPDCVKKTYPAFWDDLKKFS